ncbi:MAG: FAD-binding oxidoreductase [Gemmataceae bacterium]
MEQCTIEGFGPVPVVRPGSIAELGDLVRAADQNEQAIYPLGGRTMLDLGRIPTKAGTGIDLRGLDQVIDYPARDMTITVQAGITMARLQEILSDEHQRLPVDVPRAGQATLGGTIATNTSGPRRLGAGTLRDYVIGISAVNDDGNEFKAGGRVVKNVAGYDLCKLLTGALGTLGIVTQVTLKVRPRPEEQALVLLGADTGALQAILEKLHASRVRPMCLDLVSAKAAAALGGGVQLPEHPWLVLVGFEDSRQAVQWQIEQLQHEFTDLDVKVMREPGLWSALVEFAQREEAKVSFKANMLPAGVAAFCRDAAQAGWLLQAHAGSGIVRGQLDMSISREEGKRLLAALRQAAQARQGNVIITRCPLEWKPHLPVWGEVRSDLALMKQVRERFAPKNLFNPGRFVV